MKNLFCGIILIMILVVNTGCPKPCIEANYSFAVTSEMTPDIDSIRVGDTLLLASSFSALLKDQNTGANVNYRNANGIGSALSVSQLIIGDSIGKDAVSNFDYISFAGKIYNDKSIPRPNGVQQLTYEENNENYNLRVGLIAKAKGIYCLGIGDGLSTGRQDVNTCEKAGFQISLINTNQHFYLLNEWRPDLYLDDNGKRHVYYFKVY